MKKFIKELEKQLEDLRQNINSQIPDMFETLEKIKDNQRETERENLIITNEEKLRKIHQEKNPMILDDDLPDHYDNWINSQELEDINNLLK